MKQPSADGIVGRTKRDASEEKQRMGHCELTHSAAA